VPEIEEDCLHCEINDLVQDFIERHKTTNLPDLMAKVTESLVDVILLGPKEEWGNLLADALTNIGHIYLEKSGAVESETAH
jgi:hypothetical protein